MLSTLRKSSTGTFATNPKHRSTGNSSGHEVREEHSVGPADGQTSIDRHRPCFNIRFMAHPSSSYLDLEFVLPRRAREAKDLSYRKPSFLSITWLKIHLSSTSLESGLKGCGTHRALMAGSGPTLQVCRNGTKTLPPKSFELLAARILNALSSWQQTPIA